MPNSLFDPAVADLGFKKFFALIATSATFTFMFIAYEIDAAAPFTERFPEFFLWWAGADAPRKLLTLLAGAGIYLAVVFYGVLAIYDYLVAKRAQAQRK